MLQESVAVLTDASGVYLILRKATHLLDLQLQFRQWNGDGEDQRAGHLGWSREQPFRETTVAMTLIQGRRGTRQE
jgi:hypothetical protein